MQRAKLIDILYRELIGKYMIEVRFGYLQEQSIVDWRDGTIYPLDNSTSIIEQVQADANAYGGWFYQAIGVSFALLFAESLTRAFRFCQKILPIIWWVSVFQHALKNLVGIGIAAVCALGVFVVDPSVNDDFAPLVVAEK